MSTVLVLSNEHDEYLPAVQSPSMVAGDPTSKGATPGLSVSGSPSGSPILVHAVLAFVKAREKGDTDSLKRLVSERFSSELVEKAKRSLWDYCDNLLSSFPYQMCRDSDRRSQLVENTDDILKAFDILDTTDSIPDIIIFCEASDLPKLPSLSLDPVGEQVHANTEVLNSLNSTACSIEDKISSLISLTSSVPSNNSSNVGNSYQHGTSYAQIASIHSPARSGSPSLTKRDIHIFAALQTKTRFQ